MKTPDELLEASCGRISFKDLIFVLTYRCNYRCRDCLIGDKLGDAKTMSFNEARTIIDQAANLRTIRAYAFAGGEPFLAYDRMLEIADYVWENYNCPFSISTNCSWAKTEEAAHRKIERLHANGLRWMLASWDVFHAEFGKLEHVINAINAAHKFEIVVSLQNITTPTSFKNVDLKERLRGIVDVEKIDWVENSVVPVGLGATELQSSELSYVDQPPMDQCNAGDILNVEVDGTVKPCCGAAFMQDHLWMGNAFEEDLETIVQRSSVDPIINSLISCRGPSGLVDRIKATGRTDLLPKKYGSACELCHKVLSNEEAKVLLENSLKEEQTQLIAKRILHQHLCAISASKQNASAAE